MGKLQIAAIIVAVGIAIGAAGAWKIQGVRIDGLKVDMARLTQENTACADANASSVSTIGKLREEISGAANLCKSRVAAKNDLVSRLQRIDSIQGAPPAPAAVAAPTEALVGSEEGVQYDEAKNMAAPVAGADPLLAELNGMFPGTADRPH